MPQHQNKSGKNNESYGQHHIIHQPSLSEEELERSLLFLELRAQKTARRDIAHVIESALPTLARPIMSMDANEDAIVGALKQSLRQLETLGAQRVGLEDLLKEMKRKDDDILPKLMTSTGSYEDLFRREVAKYDHFCEEIAQNVEAQDHLVFMLQIL